MGTSPHRRLVRAPSARSRLAEAAAWLALQRGSTEVVIVGATADAVSELARSVGGALGATFGWHRFTLAQLAWTLGGSALAEQGLVPVSPLALEAIATRLVHDAALLGTLGRFEPIGERPGLPRAFARTFSELRLAMTPSSDLRDRELGALLDAYGRALATAGLADRADLFRAAIAATGATHSLLGKPLLLVDVAVTTEVERALVSALASRASSFLATVPTGDEVSVRALSGIDGLTIDDIAPAPNGALGRLQAGLFGAASVPTEAETGVEVFSSPGESRECVEIARHIHREAESGTPFDRMAIVVRSPQHYRPHLEEALRRAAIPANLARGTSRPDPSGRAFLSLLASAAEGLTASRFAEYLSIGEVPDATNEGSPPPAARAPWAPADDELTADEVLADAQVDPSPMPPQPSEAPVVDGTLRAPRLWERMLVDAAVIGGLERWKRRLGGLSEELEISSRDHDDADEKTTARILRERRALDGLRHYALPLLEVLANLPASATWGEWRTTLAALATRALRDPTRVLSVLQELAPMNDVGPVALAEVRTVLGPKLLEVVKPQAGPRYGRISVLTTAEVRGLAFDVVFVPGLAEKLFPQRISEDPVLPDAAREGTKLTTNADRRVMERLALRLAVGAATRRVVVSYPRLDLEQSRPRTPSFYGLEVLRAAEGTLPGFDELALRANNAAAAHVGWPAPVDPALAIDHAEHDLALLKTLLGRPEAETVGMARYLLDANAHLARALRFRALRWLRKWTPADGLVMPAEEARLALEAHGFANRSYSATGLQNYAGCPYRFVLQAIHRLRPRSEPEPLEELDPLQRGTLIHEVLFEVNTTLRAKRLLPVTPANLAEAERELDRVLGEVIARHEDRLCPAIPKVWEDGVARIRADVREWLRHATADTSWTPEAFELAFGPLDDRSSRDERSRSLPVRLDCGIELRGSIDLVERRAGGDGGGIRATDYKTGRLSAKQGMLIGGGKTLQPVLYALALEKILPGDAVKSGRLYFCTGVGDYTPVDVPLDPDARGAAALLATTIGDAMREGFLPAAPAKGECERCDFVRVCGPNEEKRTAKKKRDLLMPLDTLRKEP